MVCTITITSRLTLSPCSIFLSAHPFSDILLCFLWIQDFRALVLVFDFLTSLKIASIVPKLSLNDLFSSICLKPFTSLRMFWFAG
ncbi:hypothetical protein ACRALDRAFT_1059961 [Sodiomyces alcalophilus JCM 7366]|uniref:uncharacterized protein n=1 Tax=Sodiomyces alcalophilus JCM 7366 TaxID=591952 RepID=UPI0039B6E64D